MTKIVVQATIDDAVPYVYSQEEADAIVAGYPEHERSARAEGIPVLGEGAVYPIDPTALMWDVKSLPPHFVWLGGLDFGWDHPTAAVKCAWDRDNDSFYVVDAWKEKKHTPLMTAGRLRPWGAWLPWAWPHDGLQHDKGSGKQLKEQYADQGMRMLPRQASFEDNSNGVEAGIMQILDAMQTGRFFVAKHLEPWFAEFRIYHREKGKVLKEYDDLLDATRYAWMMRRHAVPEGGYVEQDEHENYGDHGWMM